MSEVSKTSILYVVLSTVRAGVEEHILTLLRGVDRQLFDLHLAVPAELIEAFGSDLPGDVEVFPCGPDQKGWVREALRLARYIRARRIGVVHSHMFRSSAFASPVAWLCRTPLVVETSHGRESWRRGWLKRSFLIDRFVNRFVDVNIAVAEANGRFLREEKKIAARKVVVVRNGCDLTRFRSDHAAPVEMRRDLGIGEQDPVALVVGRLEPQKGHAILLEALPVVVAEHPRLCVVCLGEGRLRAELEEQARRLGIAANLRFVGFQRNVSDWLALADFTVLPSLYEGLPLAAIESLAAGRTMVATAVEGTSEVILHEKTGLVVPPCDSSALAAAIRRMIGDEGLRRRLAAAGRTWVMEQFSQEQQLLKTQEIYRGARVGGAAGQVSGNGTRFVWYSTFLPKRRLVNKS